MLEILFAWPDQYLDSYPDCYISESARLYRQQSFRHAESLLLANFPFSNNSVDCIFLLSLLALRKSPPSSFLGLRKRLIAQVGSDHRYVCFLSAQYLLQTASITQLVSQPESFWASQLEFWPLLLSRAALSIHTGHLTSALSFLSLIPSPWHNSLEANRLKARILVRQARYNDSIALLVSCVHRFPQHIPLRVQLLDVVVRAKSQDKTLPVLNQFIEDFGYIPELLTLLSQIRLLQNRNSESRSTILQNRVFNSIVPNQESLNSNLYNCYDRLGLVDWLAFAPFLASQDDDNEPLVIKENLCVQAASLQMPQYSDSLSKVVKEYQLLTDADQSLPLIPSSSDAGNNPLRIVWICADVSYHPVGRFLYGFLSGLQNPIHHHTVVDIRDHGNESRRQWFDSLRTINFKTISSSNHSQCVKDIRDLDSHIAIDLSGWTSGHFMRGFLQRLAPVQLSYLGYFASTGLPTMEYWLGDSHLFPDPVCEWHSEHIWRLSRCFLAWNPPDLLPESSIDVPDSRFRSEPIRFGCFNHHRKFSDTTLRAWGAILNSIKGSKLVLKSGSVHDSGTAELLSSRMRQCGLDPESIIWIPRASGVNEHLLHYSYVDVALDCFPNGGCTTTCEALWMGVPVLTLTGSSYVSRMSTSVLYGADMSDWCVHSLPEYVDHCIAQADSLDSLRNNRDLWRRKIISNELGDSVGLMSHLESAFSRMSRASL